MVRSVNSMPVFQTMKTAQAVTPRNVTTAFRGERTQAKAPQAKDPGKVGYFRAVFSRLTNEQIKEANESGKIKGKVKFKSNQRGGYVIVPNLMYITTGTQTIPAGFELRKNWLGFTRVLPKDAEGAFIKKK